MSSTLGDPTLAEALFSLLLVCTYGAEEQLWQPFDEAMARTHGIPVTLDLAHRIFADPAHAQKSALEALDSAIDALADEPDSAQIIRVGMSASGVDRLQGCRAPLLRVLDDARRGGAVASGITAMAELATDEVRSGHWDEAEQLAAEAIQACEAHGYQAAIWLLRYVQARLPPGGAKTNGSRAWRTKSSSGPLRAGSGSVAGLPRTYGGWPRSVVVTSRRRTSRRA